MSLLLDTHAFLWFIDDSPRLSASAKSFIESTPKAMVSIASLWEIAIKSSVGKLKLPHPFDPFIPQQLALNAIELLPITITHLAALSTMPLHHRDPFDRLIVAQAFVEKIPIISADSKFDSYPITRLW